MNTVLIYDTETSGLPLFEQPSDHQQQPHIVQIGAALVDMDTRRELATLDLIVRPDGWTIPEEVAQVHGITTEMAMDLGVPEAVAVDALLAMWGWGWGYGPGGGPRLRVGHNEPFDARILRIALKRFVDPRNSLLAIPVSDEWKSGQAECTARLSTPICKLPPTERMRAARRFHHKTPNLGEAYRHFTGQELVGAHNAMVDVRACMAVYFALQPTATPKASSDTPAA